MTIKVVFFDMYNTLAGFRPSRYEVQSEACRDFGIEVTPAGIVEGYAAAGRLHDPSRTPGSR